MTRIELLSALKAFCIQETAVLSFPTAIQKGDVENVSRAPEIYLMRLPQSSAAKKYVPYIIVQYISGMDKQPHGKNSDSTTLIRFIFCVYSEDEELGAVMLINLMETVRIALLRSTVIDKKYKLDTDSGLESLIYPDDTAPYFAGELVATFIEAPVEREVFLNV